MKMTIFLLCLVLMFQASGQLQGGQEGDFSIALPAPQRSGGASLYEALNLRRSSREFSPEPLSSEHLSSLLWAAAGVNRPDTGHRTAPSARNWQEIDVYVVLPEGVYRYDGVSHSLKGVLAGDLRPVAGLQPFVRQAPLVLVYVADFERMTGADAENSRFYSAVDTGYISQNVYLFCAANNLSTVVLGMVDKAALKVAMQLRSEQHVILTQPVGYVPAPPRDSGGEAGFRNGVYRGSAYGYIDYVHVEVQIQEGRIQSVEVTEHQENRARTSLAEIPERIVSRQGTDGVDAVTRATVTSKAILEAAAKALEQAR